MKETTKQMIMVLINADSTITKAEKQALEDACNGTAFGIVSNKPIDRVLKRRQVAEILGISTKAVDWYGRKGKIKRVWLGGSRSLGYSESSVRAILDAQ